MTPERLAELRAELSREGLVINSTLFWEAAAEAIRWMTAELKSRKVEAR